MPFGVMVIDDGTVIVPPPATAPPVVAPAPQAPVVDSSDVVSRYLGNLSAAPAPPIVNTTTTAAQIAAADLAGQYASAGAAALLAGGSAADIAAAEQAAGAPDEVVQATLASGIPGVANVDLSASEGQGVATPDYIGPPIDIQEWGHDEQGDFDLLGYFPDFEERTLAAISTLKGQAFIDYVRAGCAKRGIDALVVLADAYNEGLGGGIGDNGTSYGPWQLHDGGALPRKYWNLGRNVAQIQSWAWSTSGVNYALDIMQKVAQGAGSPTAEMRAIVMDFERPSNPQAQYVKRLDTYQAFAAQGAKIWSMLAGYVSGAKFNVPSAPVAAPAKARPTQAIGAWRGFIAVLRDDVPATGLHMQNTARRLKGAVT